MLKNKSFPLSRVYRRLEPGSVALVTIAHKGTANINPKALESNYFCRSNQRT